MRLMAGDSIMDRKGLDQWEESECFRSGETVQTNHRCFHRHFTFHSAKMMIVYCVASIFFLLLCPSPAQSVSCYTCVDCADSVRGNSTNATISASSCFYCYKLTVTMAYAPSPYIVKECVQTCTESSSSFGGASLSVECCSTNLCNAAQRLSSSQLFRSLSMIVFVLWTMSGFTHFL